MQKISPAQRKKLKDFLGKDIADNFTQQEFKVVKEAINTLNDNISKNPPDKFISEVKSLDAKLSRIKNTDLTPVVDVLNKFIDTLSNNKPQDLSGFFKDLGVQLVEFGSSSKKTEELIRNLKWNSTMGIKNRDGSPISPAISPFAIRDYTDIKLTSYDASGNPGVVSYYDGDGLIAVITLTYDVSGNLTEAKRTK